MSADDHHFRREDRTIKWQRIAAHVSAHPEELEIALENIDRWLALSRVHPGPILEWRRLIHLAQSSPEEMRDFLAFLEAPNHDDGPLKSCSPLVGLSLADSPTAAA